LLSEEGIIRRKSYKKRGGLVEGEIFCSWEKRGQNANGRIARLTILGGSVVSAHPRERYLVHRETKSRLTIPYGKRRDRQKKKQVRPGVG